MASRLSLDELKAHIQSRGWRWKPGARIPYGQQIIVSDGRAEAPVSYWPKRGMMQVQGPASTLKSDLEWWARRQDELLLESPSKIAGAHIGLDEAGKGDWFGPLVVAAVYADEKTMPALRDAGARDSKLLGAESVGRVAESIKRALPSSHYHIRVVRPPEYNRLYDVARNVNILLAEVYADAAKEVWRRTQSPQIVCDQFSRRADRLLAAFAAGGLPRPIQQHRAEAASIGVAAASILASAAFTEALRDLGRAAGLRAPLPKGASDTAALEAAARFIIKRHGAAALGEYAKLNFKPVRSLLRG